MGHHPGKAASWQSLGPCPPPGLRLPLPLRVSFRFHPSGDVTAAISCSVMQLEAVSSPTRRLPHASKGRECAEEEPAQAQRSPHPRTPLLGDSEGAHLSILSDLQSSCHPLYF